MAFTCSLLLSAPQGAPEACYILAPCCDNLGLLCNDRQVFHIRNFTRENEPKPAAGVQTAADWVPILSKVVKLERRLVYALSVYTEGLDTNSLSSVQSAGLQRLLENQLEGVPGLPGRVQLKSCFDRMTIQVRAVKCWLQIMCHHGTRLLPLRFNG